MDKICMVDLRTQYLKIKDEVDKAITEVIDSTAFVKGPVVDSFQEDLEKYLNVKHVISCANGTDALQVAMMALDLKPGDEVITTNFTFIATVEVIALLGLTPVLVDVDPDTFNIDPREIEAAISDKTKAIVPVHVFGQCANMERIMEIAKMYDLAVIEDNAQAIGADYQFSSGKISKAGTIGHVGCTSFFPSKNLGCYGDGGAIFTNDDQLAEKIKSIVNHGMTVRYYHDHIGVNSRLDSIQAAILKIKLKYLDEYCRQRHLAAEYYDAAFRGNPHIVIPSREEHSTHVFHQYTIKVAGEKRTALQNHLASKGIPSMIYYPVPLHKQKAYSNYSWSSTFPVTEDLSHKVLSLPMHTELSKTQLEYITDEVLDYINRT